MFQRHPVDRAADAVGGTSNLAAALGVSIQAISNWKDRGVPIERCVAIEQITKTAVTRRDLRPQDWQAIWPELERRGGVPDSAHRTSEGNPGQRSTDDANAAKAS